MLKPRFSLISVSVSPILCFCLASCLYAQPWSGIISPSRAIAWSNAGVVGGIPTNRTQCGSTIAAGASAATIQSAINACGANQYVQLGAGTFNLTTGLVFQGINNVSIRGMGANSTFLVMTGTNACSGVYAAICAESGDLNWEGGPTNLVNWTAGYSAGTTVITLASVPNLVIGNPIILDQLDDTSDNGGILVCSSPTNPSGLVCSLDGDNGNGSRTGRAQQQIVTVTGCNGSTTVGTACTGTNVAVTISPGLYMPNWNACHASGGCSPQAWWSSSPITGIGVENMSIDSTNAGSGSAVVFFNATNSWVSGIRSIDTGRAHVTAEYAQHITVQNSYFFLTQNSIDQSYGYQCFGASDVLVQNNITQAVSGPITTAGACEDNVIAYNFSINDFYEGAGWNNAMSNMHTAGADMMLYEGNIGVSLYADVFHGTHNFNTFFRNYMSGTQPVCYASGTSYSNATYGACTNPLEPIEFDAYSRFFNVLGNVWGQVGVQTGYESGTPIYALGNGNSVSGVTVNSDPNVATTIMLWGNYDTVNAASRFVASEVPSALSAAAQAPYSNPVPGSNSLPASFYYSSQPFWWPASKPWPAIGPDVTSGNVAGLAGHVYTIPAQDCYLNTMGGSANGTGGPYSFNASSCYQGQSSVTSAPPPPSPPTSLAAVAK